ncbi:hypothetical protein K490DRAFT_52710 [Saccharata proteae CBS 121410]|uniref:Uncharacterized protein n=1 Tax=Saccharata proteae CBS 121410 TaxID=1314787 RepID=A0A9P4HYD8_9PEZI|nr:hypothetical protein K490DRAFT_52710 [Saccharata proteae CBS 121410]
MATDITTTPLHLEPLPLYRPTASDPETSSIISSCPSYVSDAPPTYHSRRPSTSLPSTTTLPTRPQPQYRIYTSLLDISAPPPPVDTRNGLPPSAYAPGFTPEPRTADDLANYNIGSFNSFRTSQHSRQYQNVATRRARAAAAAAHAHTYTALLSLPENRVASTTTPSSTGSPANSTLLTASNMTALSANSATETASLPDTEPRSPHEDPHLVGERAATAARQQRIYREACLSGADGLSWDFMMVQMGGWESRRAAGMGLLCLRPSTYATQAADRHGIISSRHGIKTCCLCYVQFHDLYKTLNLLSSRR